MLVKSILLALPTYVMSSFLLSLEICENLAGADEAIEPDINIPVLRQAPRTRSGTKRMAAGFCEAVERMFIKASLNSNLDDLSNRLDKLSISASEAKEDIPYVIQDGPRDDAVLWSIIPHKEMVSLFTISPL